jgi:phosphatidylglycerophosphate synthase
MINIDDYLVNYMMDNDKCDLFSYIHPNVITFIGIICNFYILALTSNINTCELDYMLIGLIFIIRYFSDSLDGAVARKYKKTSKIGNFLDSFSDMMFLAVMYYLILKFFNLSLYYFVFYLIFLMYMEYNYSIFTHSHDSIKKTNHNFVHNITVFLTKNTIVTFITSYLFIVYANKKLLNSY